MHIDRVDLNLLVVFDAIYTEGGITRASEKLHLTQPAISHALGRLRELFGDPLFKREGRAMVPTPLARNLIGTVQRSLRDLQIMFNDIDHFDPATTEKKFTLGMRELPEATVLPQLLQNATRSAPQVEVASVNINRQELEAELAGGVLDAAIDVLLPVSDNICHTRIYQDRMVVIARCGHPRVGEILNLDTYLAEDHVQVSSRRSGRSFEDIELSRLGLQRRLRLRCQNTYTAFSVVSNTDLLLTIAERYALIANEHFDNRILPLPLELAPFDAYLYWHSNVDNDPANRWLRNQVAGVIAAGEESRTPVSPAREARR